MNKMTLHDWSSLISD